MICAWKELLSILPHRIRSEAEPFRDRVQDIRLRIGTPAEYVCMGESITGNITLTGDDLNFVINASSRYSPWNGTTIAECFLTAPGGHRIGICGDAVMKEGRMSGIRNVSSLCIRISRDFPGISETLKNLSGSILILGAPGWGKTTLLRDLIRQKSNGGAHVSVVDQRQELFPTGFDRGTRTEVLSGCPKAQGMEMLIRTMGPNVLAVDEITAEEDCHALTQAAWCGVSLLATAHAGSLVDYLHRDIYRPLVQQNLFDHLVILHPDRHWHLERSGTWTTNGSARH